MRKSLLCLGPPPHGKESFPVSVVQVYTSWPGNQSVWLATIFLGRPCPMPGHLRGTSQARGCAEIMTACGELTRLMVYQQQLKSCSCINFAFLNKKNMEILLVNLLMK
ncbi:hypothetical protein SAY87_008089 [Trapa incisa]|uniref:Uncharacterized protein n=1 Tax=Trapa incisa TaxID=236973 RepID=A0AAN7KP81_9MYRT|nr:hypothetical protein SAY87_008089 [Trapa incisa]